MTRGRDPLRELQFDWREAMRRAQRAVAEPPPLEHLERPKPRGVLVRKFALPLSLCPTTNRTRHSRPGQHAKTKAQIYALMRAQARVLRWPSPLSGRPQVLCYRLSSVEPDKYSDWAKLAIDCLCVPQGRRRDGLGLLRDDRPRDAEIWQLWHPAPRGAGLVYIEVRS